MVVEEDTGMVNGFGDSGRGKVGRTVKNDITDLDLIYFLKGRKHIFLPVIYLFDYVLYV